MRTKLAKLPTAGFLIFWSLNGVVLGDSLSLQQNVQSLSLDEHKLPVPRDLQASFLTSDVHIVAEWIPGRGPTGNSDDFPPWLRRTMLMIQEGGHLRPLSSIVQLRGLVSIDSSAKALEFVRLRTSVDLDGALSGDGYPSEAEVVPLSEIASLPSFGIGYNRLKPNSLGYFGLLSDDAFARAGFYEPRVQALQGGDEYIISRWTFSAHGGPSEPDYRGPKYTVQEISEIVSSDGEYQRIELQRKKPPSLPNTNWTFGPGGAML